MFAGCALGCAELQVPQRNHHRHQHTPSIHHVGHGPVGGAIADPPSLTGAVVFEVQQRGP
eukprot:11651639-Prorocentrum_lima.AAC.1